MITRDMLSTATGYSKKQIEWRRQRYWREGRHYIVDPAGATMYNLEEIFLLERGSPRKMGSVSFDGTRGENVIPGRWTSPTREKGSPKLLE